MNVVRVVAAVVERDGRFLLGRRPEGKRHGGLWEFPGGKIDSGETLADAVRRELSEELAMDIEAVGDSLLVVEDADTPFVIDFIEVSAVGSPVAHEHSEVGWFFVTELKTMALAPADAEFVAWLVESVPSA